MKIVLPLILSLAIYSCQSDKQQAADSSLLDATELVKNPESASGVSSDTASLPEISFDGNTQHDFGKIEEGEMVQYGFKFKNTGKNPLLIAKVESSCGCTVPDYPYEPIAHGEEGVIKVTYDSKGRPGEFQKTVYVIANTFPNETKLTILGTVNPAE